MHTATRGVTASGKWARPLLGHLLGPALLCILHGGGTHARCRQPERHSSRAEAASKAERGGSQSRALDTGMGDLTVFLAPGSALGATEGICRVTPQVAVLCVLLYFKQVSKYLKD